MNVVYFGEELQAKAPEYMGCLCLDPSHEWVGIMDVVEAIRRGEVVVVRPASESEMRRAEAYVALADIGEQLGRSLGALLDHGDDKEMTAKATEFREALESIEAPAELLDRK